MDENADAGTKGAGAEPAGPAQHLKDAILLHQQGKLAEAEILYRRVLADRPNTVDALHNLGLIRMHRGEPEHAVQLIGQALSHGPDLARAHSNFAVAI